MKYEYYIDNVKHVSYEGFAFGNLWDKMGRDGDLPSFVEYYDDGILSSEEWWSNGQHHRDNDLPAFISYNVIGNIWCEKFYTRGYIRSEGIKPSIVRYTNEGKWAYEIFKTKINHNYGFYQSYYMNEEPFLEYKDFYLSEDKNYNSLLLNSKSNNPIIQQYCQKELIKYGKV